MNKNVRVLCYGDSNTWGYIADSGQRYPIGVRWTSVLEKETGFEIIEEGYNGRTSAFDDPADSKRNGLKSLPYILQKTGPIDLIIVMLGTNDIKFADFESSLSGILSVCHKAISQGISKLLLVSPVPHALFLEDVHPTLRPGKDVLKEFAKTGIRLQQEVLKHNWYFFDAGSCASVSPLDGTHLDAASHIRLGKALAKMVIDIFSTPHKDTGI